MIFELLQSAAIPDKPNISADISLRDFVLAINIWNENTNTSPSGCDLGQYNLLGAVYQDKHNKPALKEISAIILQLFVSLLNLVSTKGFALDRWKTVVNIMIYKKPGVYLIDQLRVIHLFEADYNFLIGLIYSADERFTRELSMRCSTQTNGLNRADVVILNKLTLGMAHMLKINLGGFENDAATCYVRILLNLMGTAFASMGIPEGPL